MAGLIKDGYTVYIPFGGHHRADFIIDNDMALIKAQCKTGRIRDGVLIFDTVSRDKKWSTREVESRGYRDEVDVFLVYCPEVDKIWSVPVAVVPEGKGHLRIEPTKNHQTVGVKFAADYEGLDSLRQ